MTKAAAEVWTGTWEGAKLRVTLSRHRGDVWCVSTSEFRDGVFSTHPDVGTKNIRKARAVLRGDGFVKE